MRLLTLFICTVLVVSAFGAYSAAAAGPKGQVVFSWGENPAGELGNGTTGDGRDRAGEVKDALNAGLLGNVKAISAGASTGYALADDGTVWAWGLNDVGELANLDAPNDSNLPVQVLNPSGASPLDHIIAIAAGAYHCLALRDDGTLWAWGYDNQGQLGNGPPKVSKDLPVQVMDEAGTGFLTDVTRIAAGYDHSLAMTADGAVYAWGANGSRQLGNTGAGKTSDLPVRVMDATGTGFLGSVSSLAAGADSSFALAKDGGVWAWGINEDGEAGDGTTDAFKLLPVRVQAPGGDGNLTNVKAIATGDYHILATMEDGSALAWGYNNHGQLGNNDLGTSRNLPVRVFTATGPLTGVATMAGGYHHSLAVRSDGTVWAWGDGAKGQRGDAAAGDLDEAVQVLDSDGPLTNVVAVAGGLDSDSSFALARTATATLDAPARTRSRTIPVELTGTSVFDVDAYYVSESRTPPEAFSAGWHPTPPITFTLSPTQGRHSMYGFVRDTRGFVSAAAMRSVVLDSVAPTARLSLPGATKSRRVAIQLSGTDAGGVKAYFVSLSATRPKPDTAGWKAKPPKSVLLAAGPDSARKVYAWTKDIVGNVSATATAGTLLDTHGPAVTVTSPRQDAKLRSLDAVSGQTSDPSPSSGFLSQRAAIRWKQGTACSWWKPAQRKLVLGPCDEPAWFGLPRSKSWSKSIGALGIAGSYVLYVESVDKAGNEVRVTRRFDIAP